MGQLLITFDESKIDALQEDRQKRREEIRQGYGVGLARVNEWRNEMGLELLDEDEGNVRVVPMNLLPFDSMMSPPDDVNENPPKK